MALLTDFYLGAELNDSCEIIVTDNTTYPYGGTYALEDIGLALFWDVAAFAGPTISGADISSPNQGGVNAVWTIVPNAGLLYNIRVFLTPVYGIGEVYGPNCIVYYNGDFWYTAGGAALGSVPVIGSMDWVIILAGTPVEIATAYALFVVCDLALNLFGYADANEQSSCDILTITKTACNSYHIRYNGLDVISGLHVYAYGDPNTLLTDLEWLPSTIDIEWDITVPGDGVYIVEVREGPMPPPKPLVNTFYYAVIYEYCSLWNCYQAIFQTLVCGQYNPCCTTCDPETLKKMENYRQALNIMNGFMFSIWAYINVERVTYLGIFDMNTTREEYVTRVGSYITKAKSLMIECGWCTQISSESEDPCVNCE